MKTWILIGVGAVLITGLVSFEVNRRGDMAQERDERRLAAYEEAASGWIEERNRFEQEKQDQQERERIQTERETARSMAQWDLENWRRMDREKIELMKERHKAENEIAKAKAETELMQIK